MKLKRRYNEVEIKEGIKKKENFFPVAAIYYCMAFYLNDSCALSNFELERVKTGYKLVIWTLKNTKNILEIF